MSDLQAEASGRNKGAETEAQRIAREAREEAERAEKERQAEQELKDDNERKRREGPTPKEKLGRDELFRKLKEEKAAMDATLRGITDEDLERRFDALSVYFSDHLQSGKFRNPGLEIGRPALQPVDALKPDLTDVFTRPSLDVLLRKRFRPEANGIATGQQIVAIYTKLEGLGVPAESITSIFWDFAIYCATSSSSEAMNPTGSIDFPGGAIGRDTLAATIRDHCTLRQFCRAYAPITWNFMCSSGNAPANWQAKGFRKQDRFAAFDCFDYVECAAAQQPLEGLIRLPTESEKIAHQTHKQIALDKNAKNARYSNFSTEVTGGKFGCDVNRKWRESK
ncbi:coat protein [Birch carlavirus]|uniref:Capsid protein n=1 Tax=Birch carlavirus TaxID=2248769 RepID=A0AAE5YHI0_9VIRU|nr:coat protein [Birch carlavirus]QBJ27542.1 coat protein [Birch carlavirus]